jgi:hypothetical protein
MEIDFSLRDLVGSGSRGLGVFLKKGLGSTTVLAPRPHLKEFTYHVHIIAKRNVLPVRYSLATLSISLVSLRMWSHLP